MQEQINKNDISSIISIVPIEIREFKPAIYPGNFNIDACLDQKVPVILHIGESNHVVSIANQRNPLMVPTSSYRMAQSIVDDYCNSQIGLSPGAKPGLFFFQGKVTLKELLVEGNLKDDDVRLDYRKGLELAREQQKNWFNNIFRMADNDWNRYKNHRSISDLARVGAKIYGVADKKEWMVEANIESVLVDCPRCYDKIDSRASICKACGCVVNPEKDKMFKQEVKVA